MSFRLRLLGLLGAALAVVATTALFWGRGPDRSGGKSAGSLSETTQRVATGQEPSGRINAARESQPELGSLNAGCSVRGFVISNAGPVANVSVLARVMDENVRVKHVTKRTDSTGRFVIDGLPTGMCNLVARSTSAIGTFAVRLTPTEPVAQVRIILQTGKPLGGRVEDPEGNPAPDAEVVPYARDQDELGTRGGALAVRTGADGRFAFDLLDGRFWRFRISATGFAPVVTAPIETGTDSAVVRLSYGGSVSGTVVHAADRTPVPGVLVGIHHAEAGFEERHALTTDAGGFEIGGLAPGSYTASVDDDAYVLVSPVTIQLPTEGSAQSGIELPVDAGVSVTGRVFDAESSQPIARAQVRAFPLDRPGKKRESVATEETGRYQIDHVHRGSVQLAVTELPVEYTAGIVTQNVNFSLDTETVVVDFPLRRSLTVRGRVVDDAAIGVAGARVLARVTNHGAQRSVSTNASGTFAIAGFSAGEEVYLSARTADGVAPELGPFSVPSEGLSGIEIVLSIETGASIAGIVTDKTGAPTECVVFAKMADPSTASSLGNLSGQTGPDGTFMIAGLAAGQYDLMLGERNPHLVQGVYHAGKVQVETGQRLTGVRLVYEIDPRSEISGQVTDRSGEAISHTQVIAAGQDLDDTTDHVTYTGADGTFVLSGLTGEAYRLEFIHDHFAREIVDGVAAGTSGIDIVLRSRATLSGSVVEEGGSQPVTQFQIAVVPGRETDEGVSLTGAQFQLVSDPLGHFQIETDAGSAILVTRAVGYAQQTTAVGRIKPDDSIGGIVVVLSRGAHRLEGVVHDAGGRPVPSAVVSATGEKDLTTTEVQTGSDGRFAIDGLSAGNVYIVATHPDYGASRVVAALSEKPSPPVEIALLEFGSLAGTVTLNGDPLPETTVTIVGDLGMRSVSAQTDVNGDFEFTSVPSGAAVVQVRAIPPNQADAATFEQEVFVVPGEPTPLEVALESN